MRTLLLPVILLVATVGAIAVTCAAASSAAPSTWTTEHYLATESWHAFADIGKRDDGGPDDVYAAQQELRNTKGKRVGVVNGYGINLHPPYVFFHWTARLRAGTVTLEGAVNLKSKATVYAVEGGTGRYAAVRGTATLMDAGSKGSLISLRYRR